MGYNIASDVGRYISTLTEGKCDMGLDVNSKQVPVVTVNFPPMPIFSDFKQIGPDGEPLILLQNINYSKALEAWKEACATMSRAINLK
jgi:hypothetical protein